MAYEILMCEWCLCIYESENGECCDECGAPKDEWAIPVAEWHNQLTRAGWRGYDEDCEEEEINEE